MRRRILLVTAGIGGDLFPFLAIERELTLLGHEVTVATPPLMSRSLGHLGDRRAAVGSATAERTVLRRAAEVFSEEDGAVRSWIRSIEEYFAPWCRSAVTDLAGLAAGADLVCTHSLAWCGYEAAVRTGTPVTTVQIFPCLAAETFPDWSSWAAAYKPTAEGPSLLARLAALLDTAPDGASASLWERWAATPQVTLLETAVAQRAGLSSRRPDELAGFPLWCPDLRLDDDTLAFLDAGGGPRMVLCQGSVLGRYRRRVTDVVTATACQVGARLVVLGDNPANFGSGTWERDHLRVAQFLPLREVARHVDLAVHHGGAGSMREVLLSGAPDVVVPGPFDTGWNARLLAGLGTQTTVVDADAADELARACVAGCSAALGAAARAAGSGRARQALSEDAAKGAARSLVATLER